MKTLPIRQIVMHGGALAALSLLAACGKNNPTDTTSPAAAPEATPAPAATAPAATPMAPAGTVAPVPAPAMTSPTPATSSANGTGNGTASAAAPGGLQVADLALGGSIGKNYGISHPTTTFKPSQDTIYASVDTTGASDGATLSARFSYLEGKGQEVTAISQTIATDGPATTTFKVHNPNDWPQGRYKVDIALDGKPVASRTFEVKA